MDLEKHRHVDKDVYVGDECWIFKDLLKIQVGRRRAGHPPRPLPCRLLAYSLYGTDPPG